MNLTEIMKGFYAVIFIILVILALVGEWNKK